MATYEQQNISQHEQIIDNVEKVSILSRHWKDHLKNDRRSDQDHRLKLDKRSDQDHPFNKKNDLLRSDHISFFALKGTFLRVIFEFSFETFLTNYTVIK
jgi:hypothetical protein